VTPTKVQLTKRALVPMGICDVLEDHVLVDGSVVESAKFGLLKGIFSK
jgi:hypothetical protein